MSEKFGKGLHFEERLVQSLLLDHVFAEQMTEVLDVEYFSLDVLKEITRTYFDYYAKYKALPSIKLLLTIINSDCKDDVVKEQCISFFEKIKKNPLNGDLEYIKEESLEFCRKRRLLNTLSECIDLVEDKKYDAVVSDIQKAIRAGSEKNLGSDLVESFEARMVEDKLDRVPMPWPQLNEITGGGLACGKLAVIMAPSGVGKSHALVDIAVHAAKQGKNVVFYSFELDEVNIGKRCDSRLSEIQFDDLIKNKEIVKLCLDNLKGKIVIKYFPTKTATALTLKNHIHRLVMNDTKPDVMVVDYADLMKSSKGYNDKRFEEENCFEELRGLAGELNIPIYTATQSNRSSLDVEVLTMKHVAECFAKAQISDLFITMNRKKDTNVRDFGNFYIAKNRLGVDGMKINIAVTTGLSKIEIATPDMEIELLEEKLKSESQQDKLKRRLKETMSIYSEDEREKYEQ